MKQSLVAWKTRLVLVGALAALLLVGLGVATSAWAQESFTITASAGPGGSVDPDGARSYGQGEEAAYTITPDACYRIVDVLVDDQSQGAISTYTFQHVDNNHTISATFAFNTYTITASASGVGGTISPSGPQTVDCAGSAGFDISTDLCYSVADVLVDGVSQGPMVSYRRGGRVIIVSRARVSGRRPRQQVSVRTVGPLLEQAPGAAGSA